jgi:FAD:protein FMN transferase
MCSKVVNSSVVSVTILLSMLIVSCSDAGERSSNIVTITGKTMGTVYNVKLTRQPANASLQEVESGIQAILDKIDSLMSTYRADSELSRFNRFKGVGWFDVSPETAKVIAEARRVSEITDGAFDATVGPLVDLWRFGPNARLTELPSKVQIEKTKQRVGFHRLDVRLEPPSIRKTMHDLHVDLSAIAKGYAVDMVCEYLKGLPVSGYMVEIGGEVRTEGKRNDGMPWSIGIESPMADRRFIHKVIRLQGKAMATSGDYRNFYEFEGKRYSHTIDPQTGKPVEHDSASVSVVADSCMHADAMATALMVLGPDRGFQLANDLALPVLFLSIDRQGNTTERMSPSFALMIQKTESSPFKLLFITVAIFGLAMAGMAVGVFFKRRQLRGSCGGLAGLANEQGHPMCDVCTEPPESCKFKKNTR